jgi:hypothetical protein
MADVILSVGQLFQFATAMYDPAEIADYRRRSFPAGSQMSEPFDLTPSTDQGETANNTLIPAKKPSGQIQTSWESIATYWSVKHTYTLLGSHPKIHDVEACCLMAFRNMKNMTMYQRPKAPPANQKASNPFQANGPVLKNPTKAPGK